MQSMFSCRTQEPGHSNRVKRSLFAWRTEPAILRYIEDYPVGVLELAFEVHLFLVGTEIEMECPSVSFDLFLSCGQVIDLES